MFQPASLKGESPVPIDEGIRNRYLIIYIIIVILSFIPCSLFEYIYVFCLWRERLLLFFSLLLPINFFILIYILQFSAILFSALFLTIINLIFPPKEGIFTRDMRDRNYFYWNLRNLIKKWALFITSSNPFPWLKNRFTLRFFGVRIGRNAICDSCWISSEFVNIGNNVIVGKGSTLLSFGIEQNKFILREIQVEDEVLIGAKCVLLPGTILEKGVKLSAHSYTDFNDLLKEDSIYLGHPAELKEL